MLMTLVESSRSEVAWPILVESLHAYERPTLALSL